MAEAAAQEKTEKANIKSVTEFWDLLKAVLKNI